jgi:transcriptional regulator with XRE-family HTH domain
MTTQLQTEASEEASELVSARVARRLREARIAARMTVREVAGCLNVNHTLIVKYENGLLQPSLNRLDALARLYGSTAAALLTTEDAAVQLFATLDQASAAQLAQFVAALNEINNRANWP